MKRVFAATSGAALAAALTFVLAGSAHAAVGEVVLIQSNGSTALSTRIAQVDNVTNPVSISDSEIPGATEAAVENRTDETIRVTVDGRTISVRPQEEASLPETGYGEIFIMVPAGN